MAFFKFRKGADASAATAATAQESIETMRRRAKHRLLGAAVLVLIAVIGFPVLFEVQPRPVAVNIPIEIPDKNKVKPLVMPAAPAAPAARNAASGPVEAVPKASSVGAASAPALARPNLPQATASAARGNVVPAAASIGDKEEIIGGRPAAKAEAKASAPVEAKATDGDKAKALLEGKEPEKVAAVEARYVVQVGAFADADRARDVRQKLERAGLKTYTQVVETQEGKRTRVRVGPFASRDQAEQVAEKIKAIELPAAVLAL